MMAESDSDCTLSTTTHGESKFSHRKTNKPLMEKRRRARINSCLIQLKSLVLQALKKDNAQFSKLEKADILEMTVKHLRALQRQQLAAAMTSNPTVVAKYRAGFNECAGEVMRYLGAVQGINDDIKTRVLGHLAGCIQTVNTPTDVPNPHPQVPVAVAPMAPHPAFIPNQCPPGYLTQFQKGLSEQCNSTPLSISTGDSANGLPYISGSYQLIPSNLPSGQFAFVLASPSPVTAVPLYAVPPGGDSSSSCSSSSSGSVKQELPKSYSAMQSGRSPSFVMNKDSLHPNTQSNVSPLNLVHKSPESSRTPPKSAVTIKLPTGSSNGHFPCGQQVAKLDDDKMWRPW